MKFIAFKTKDGGLKGDISFYCQTLHVSRQGFYRYPANKDRSWKYQPLADTMMEILAEDECNDTYGRIRMYQALTLKQPENVNIKRDFKSEKPPARCVTDITGVKTSDGKLYVSAISDCFDSSVTGLGMDTNMKALLCVQTLENAAGAYPGIRGAIIHSDRGSRYTSRLYRDTVHQYGIRQSMNSAGGRCHDNARCGSMRGRMKSELLYERNDTEKMRTDEVKTLIWRYFISYWNNRRVCSANGGLPPMIKRQRYYDSLKEAAQDAKSLRKCVN